RFVLVREDWSIPTDGPSADPRQPTKLEDCTFVYDLGTASNTVTNRCSLMIDMIWKDKQINPNQTTGGSSVENALNKAQYRF
ncbi:MAG: hypothetical protein K2P98_00740, partial [Neisseriaceae bacterium]|nr:hypothetical protein [Neisseriaceae bacterium]